MKICDLNLHSKNIKVMSVEGRGNGRWPMAQWPRQERKPGPSGPESSGRQRKDREENMQKIPTCFEEMQMPRLNQVDSKLNGVQREIVICCKKCEAYPGGSEVYKWIQMSEIIQWLQAPEEDFEVGLSETEPTTRLATMNCCVSAMEFYLEWRNSDRYLSRLLRRWIHTVIQDNDPRFAHFDSSAEVKVGQYLIAFYIKDGRWYRAKVLHRLRPIPPLFCVQLIDDGVKLELEVSRLRHLPEELHPPKCRPLAFRCQITGLENFSQVVHERVICTFVRAVRDAKHLQAAVNKIDEDTGVRSVTLWDLENDNSINSTVIEAAHKRSKRSDPEWHLECKEIAKDMIFLKHMNSEIQIENFNDIKLKGLRHWRITSVESPWEFYMQNVNPLNPHENVHWKAHMQNFYNDPILRVTYRVETSRIYKRRHYVWWDKDGFVWHRVRAVDSDISSRTATVFFVDIGSTRVVSYDDLWELNKDYSEFSSIAFRTFLADVAPTDGGDTWPKESTDAFKHLVMGEDKIFHGVMVAGAIVHNPVGGRGEETMQLGMILVENNPEVTYTVQAALVVFGLAQSTGISSCRSDIFEHCGFGKRANFNFEAFKAYQQQDFLPEGTELANLQLRSNIIDKERLEMLRQNVLQLPDELSSPHIIGSYTSFSVATDNTRDWLLPQEIQRVLPQLKLAQINHPGCIYVQRTSALEDFSRMTYAIGEIVENNNGVTEENIKPGDFVAVLYQLNSDEDPCWYRACVRQVVESLEIVKVILVDFGLDVLSKLNIIRILPDYFKTIPGFAHRIHLEVPNLVPVGSITWNATCVSNFPRYIRSWEEVDPSYLIWCPSSSSVLSVDSIHQQVVYNRNTGLWSLISVPSSMDSENPLTDFRHEPLLINLFYSHGVCLEFEIKNQEGYGFGTVADLLVNMGFATFKKADDLADVNN